MLGKLKVENKHLPFEVVFIGSWQQEVFRVSEMNFANVNLQISLWDK